MMSLRSISRTILVLSRHSSTVTTQTAAKALGKSRRERIAPIILTEKAANRIKELIQGKDEAVVGVKLGVRRRGCNGYSYTMNYATKEDLDMKVDEVVEAHGVKVLVDPKAVFFLVGTVMEFEETSLSSEFTFHNPNAKGACGCGESFNV